MTPQFFPDGRKKPDLTQHSSLDTVEGKSVIAFRLGGDFVSVRRRTVQGSIPHTSGGKRGVVSEFSSSSRRRLMKMIGSMKNTKIPVFLTLTYQDFSLWESDLSACKKHLDIFLKRLKRRFPKSSAIWRLEFQKRGVPHFHMLLWGVTAVEADLLWVVSNWVDIIGGSDDVRNFHLGLLAGSEPCLQQINSWRGVKSYASKYLAKGGENSSLAGRFWGVFNRAFLPVAPLLSCLLSQHEVNTVLRYIRRYTGRRQYFRGGFVLASSTVWLRLLAYKLEGSILSDGSIFTLDPSICEDDPFMISC